MNLIDGIIYRLKCKDDQSLRGLGIIPGPLKVCRAWLGSRWCKSTDIYQEIFSEYSYGFRLGRSCHDAIRQALCCLKDGYEWVVDIEQFFDRVNHDKLIQILRE